MRCRILLIGMLVIVPFLASHRADGQIIRRLRARRAAGETPLLDRASNLARRLRGQDLVPNEQPEPTPAPQKAQTQQARGGQTPAPQVLSVQEIQALDLTGLQRALGQSGAQLQEELTRFNSAQSWQGFLAQPVRQFSSASISADRIAALHQRFERVATDGEFYQVSSLDSFGQTRVLLAELSSRLAAGSTAQAAASSGPKLIDPAANTVDTGVAAASFEEKTVSQTPANRSQAVVRSTAKPATPTPQPVAATTVQGREHSILVQRP